MARLASCNSFIQVGRVNEDIDITPDGVLEITRVLFVEPTTPDVFSRNVDDVPNRVAPFYRVEVWLGWVGVMGILFFNKFKTSSLTALI